jgi:hypothetical protein
MQDGFSPQDLTQYWLKKPKFRSKSGAQTTRLSRYHLLNALGSEIIETSNHQAASGKQPIISINSRAAGRTFIFSFSK